MAKSALGRGFGALMGGNQKSVKNIDQEQAKKETDEHQSGQVVERVAIGKVFPSLLQPRKIFPQEGLEELTESIRAQGVLQPLVVRKCQNGYELIAGERRLRASKLAGLTEVPIIIRAADDHTVLELMLIENLQRENLNPMDEARGYERLIREFKITQEDAAKRVGKSRVVVTNALRLLKLPQTVQAMITDGRITTGHAKAILGLQLFEEMQVMAERVVAGGLSVRQTEELVNSINAKKASKSEASKKSLSIHLQQVENAIRERFKTQVRIKSADGKKGRLEIQFYDKDDLNRLLDLLNISVD